MSLLDTTQDHLRDAIRQGRGLYTSITRARPTAALPETLTLFQVRALHLVSELEAHLRTEEVLRTAPHAYARGFQGCCATCGGAEDRQELHPPEMRAQGQEAAVHV